MPIVIRCFATKDIADIVEILKLNNQYSYPEIEGPEAMLRVAKCDAAIFLVAVESKRVIGCIKAVYDGSRALIHLLSVHPEYQHHSTGTKLVNAVVEELKAKGAPTASVTVTASSESYWDKLGFNRVPAFLLLRPIDLKLKPSSQTEYY